MIILYRDTDGLVVFEERPNTTPSYLSPDIKERASDQHCMDCYGSDINQHGRCSICNSQAIA